LVQKIKAGAVSYLNTKPLIYGFEQGKMKDEVELLIDNPANIAKLLLNNEIDIGLVPVATIPLLKEHYIVSDYGIACDGEVASVCLFSDVPLADVETILLDYQSRTSVALLKILLKEHWKILPQLVDGKNNFVQQIDGTIAGLVIGDRALLQRGKHKYIYDLGLAWKELTGLPFVFAAWVSNKKLPASFCEVFNDTTKMGLMHIEEIVAQNPFEAFNLEDYYNNCIKFRIDLRMHEALTLFLTKLNSAL
jgi:chorismate dehydratase